MDKLMKDMTKQLVNSRRMIYMMAFVIFILAMGLAYVSSYNINAITNYNDYNNNIKSNSFSSNMPVLQEGDSIMHTMPIVSVSSGTNKGEVDSSVVKLIKGNNQVLVNTDPFVEPDLQYSAEKAVYVAENITNYSGNNMDFVYYFGSTDAQLIGGESAGAAMTINTIAALEDMELRNDTLITGTINSDGTIGKVGGIYEKAQAVGNAGYKYFIVPKGQSAVTSYESKVVKKNIGKFRLDMVTYVPTTVDIKKIAKDKWGLEVIEVSNITEALSYFEIKS